MPTTKKFKNLSDPVHRDPAHAARVNAAKARALEEHASYRLAELRRALGLTQAELAALIGKTQSAVSQIEHGDIALSVDALRAIVTQLGGNLEITAVFEDRRVLIDT